MTAARQSGKPAGRRPLPATRLETAAETMPMDTSGTLPRPGLLRYARNDGDAAVQQIGWRATTSRDWAALCSGSRGNCHLERLASPWIASLRSQ